MNRAFMLLAISMVALVTQASFADDVKITPEEAKMLTEVISSHPQVVAQLQVIPSALGTQKCVTEKVEVRTKESKEYYGNTWLSYKCPALDGEMVTFSANATVYKENGSWKAFVTSLWTSKK